MILVTVLCEGEGAVASRSVAAEMPSLVSEQEVGNQHSTRVPYRPTELVAFVTSESEVSSPTRDRRQSGSAEVRTRRVSNAPSEFGPTSDSGPLTLTS